MKKALLITVITFFVSSILAHEFWLQPEKFMYTPGEHINVRFWVGEDFDGSNWSGNHGKVKSLQLWLEDITDDIAGQVGNEKGDSLQLSIFDEGTAMITFNSTNSFIRLDAAKFNTYLTEDGLTGALDYRRNHHELDTAGREYYQRSVKTLVQVGNRKTTVSRATGLPLDIIPLSNPYTVKNGDSLTIKLLFQKQPLANQLVYIWQRVNGKTAKTFFHTDTKGHLGFVVQTKGMWMVSAVHMQHLDNDTTANWQSYWGSCTWGYQ